MPNPFQTAPITITKLDAARRQVRSAIELWFAEGDPVSILTLSYAGYEVIHRLYRKQGLRDLLYDTSIIKDEYRRDFTKLLKTAPNFFKHANREDAKETISFTATTGDLFLVMSLVGLQRMGEPLNDLERAFQLWFAIHYPDEGFTKALTDKGIPVDEARGALAVLTKSGFLETLRNSD